MHLCSILLFFFFSLLRKRGGVVERYLLRETAPILYIEKVQVREWEEVVEDV